MGTMIGGSYSVRAPARLLVNVTLNASLSTGAASQLWCGGSLTAELLSFTRELAHLGMNSNAVGSGNDPSPNVLSPWDGELITRPLELSPERLSATLQPSPP